MFAKNYFDSNYVREKHVRAAYDYFHKHKSIITNSPITIDEEEDESCKLERNVEPEPETKQNIISLPRLETVSNSNFFYQLSKCFPLGWSEKNNFNIDGIPSH